MQALLSLNIKIGISVYEIIIVAVALYGSAVITLN